MSLYKLVNHELCNGIVKDNVFYIDELGNFQELTSQLHNFINPQTYTPGPETQFDIDVSELTGGEGVTKIVVEPVLPGTLEGNNLLVEAHGCAHPTTQPPTTTSPPSTTTSFQSTTTSESTTPKECYDTIGEASQPSEGSSSYTIELSKAFIVNEVSIESTVPLSEFFSFIVKVFTLSSDSPVSKVIF